MKISNEAKHSLKITYITTKDKSTAIGLVDSYKDSAGKWQNFFWNCSCINKAKQIVDTLEKGDCVSIKEADVYVSTDGKGRMLVYSLEKAEPKVSNKGSEQQEDNNPTTSLQDFDMGDFNAEDDDKPF